MSLHTTCRYCNQVKCTPRFSVFTYDNTGDITLSDFTKDLNITLERLGLSSRWYVTIHRLSDTRTQKLVFIDTGITSYRREHFVVNGNIPSRTEHANCHVAATVAKEYCRRYSTYLLHPGDDYIYTQRLLT